LLVWQDQMHRFFEQVVSGTDAIVFIGPDHLSTIRVRGWSGATKVITVPQTLIYETWPSVLPVVVSRLDEIVRRHSRVCILVQAALMSVTIGVAVHLMRSMHPSSRIHYFDMGQSLDVAGYPDRTPPAPWLNRAVLQDVLKRRQTFPIYLA
jgi:hypothetical protein